MTSPLLKIATMKTLFAETLRCKIFLGCTLNLISSGITETFLYHIDNHMVRNSELYLPPTASSTPSSPPLRRRSTVASSSDFSQNQQQQSHLNSSHPAAPLPLSFPAHPRTPPPVKFALLP
ncbi:unnamed protein product [Linum trigynum]|uniref:Uncharacterized protein n=1 Tax=Linum trigynum TaxID=586398 RepID=A0AAV2DZI8_9ROSI